MIRVRLAVVVLFLFFIFIFRLVRTAALRDHVELGYHRLLAAMLATPEAFDRLRFFCGLSPKMAQCCWYQTNVATLARYARNMVRYFAHDPDKELVRLLERADGESQGLVV